MITPYQLLQESGFAQYTAMVRFHYNRDNTSLGAEKIAEMVRAIPGATRVSTVSLDKEHGIGIFNVKIISMKPPKEAYQALKQNALERYRGLITGVEVGANTIETKGDFIIKENLRNLSESNLGQYLGQLLEEGLLLEVSIDELRRQWVESGKMDEETFNQVVQASNDQSNYATWLVKKVGTELISTEDLQLWSEIFSFFDRYKQRFQKRDINQVKTQEDITAFIEDYNNVKDAVENQKSSGMNKSDAEKTDPCLLGKFKTSDGQKWTVYKTQPGQWQEERKIGSGTKWCTVANKYHFDYYMGPEGGNDKAYYIFINQKDPKEKYQIHYGSDQCKDTEDEEIDRSRECFLEFFEYLKEKENRDFPPKTEAAKARQERQKSAGQRLDSVPSVLQQLDHYDVENLGRIYKINSGRQQGGLDYLAKALKETVNCSNTEAIRIAENIVYRGLSHIVVIPLKSGRFDIVAHTHYDNELVSIDTNNNHGFDTKLPKCNEGNFQAYEAAAYLLGTNISKWVKARCDKSLPGKEEFLVKNGDGEKIYRITPEQNKDGKALKALMQLNFPGYLIENANPTLTFICYKGPITQQESILFSCTETNGLNFFKNIQVDNEWDYCVTIYTLFEHLVSEKVVEKEILENSQFRGGKVCKKYGNLDQYLSSIEKVNLEGISEGVTVGVFKDLYTITRRETDNSGVAPAIFKSKDNILVGCDNTILIWRPTRSPLDLRPVYSRQGYLDTEIPLEDILKFSQHFNLDLPTVLEKLLARSRKTTDFSNVLRILYHNNTNNNLRPVSLEYRKSRYRNLYAGGNAVYGTWDQLGTAIKYSSPHHWSEINRIVNAHPEANVDAAFWYNGDNPRKSWNGIVRVIENGAVVAYALKKSSYSGEDRWEVVDNVPEDQRVYLDGQQSPQNNYTAPAPRRAARQPRQAQAAQPAAPIPELTPEQQQQIQQSRIQVQNAPEAYRFDLQHTRQGLAALGFTNISQELAAQPNNMVQAVVYRTYDHRGNTSHVALLYANNANTVVAGYPQNPTLAIAEGCSQAWRRLTQQLDNSVRTFQQCHDICQELHIPVPPAIQGWLVYRGQ